MEKRAVRPSFPLLEEGFDGRLLDHGHRITTVVNLKTGRKHGSDSQSPFDSWFRYPAGFSVETLDLAFNEISSVPKGAVLDPFAGVATVGTRAAAEGRSFVGIEAHPLIADVARLKLRRPAHPLTLLHAAEEVAARAKAVDPTDEAELVVRSFSPEILAELIGLRTAIEAQPAPWNAYLELALLSLLRDHARVKVGWPYQLPGKRRQPRLSGPTKRFLQLAERMASDLEDGASASGWVTTGDSRQAANWRTARRREPVAMISSPPYLNNFDYADATRLELYFSGRARSWAEMCATVRDGMVIASTQQSKRQQAEQALKQLEQVEPFHRRLTPLVESLAAERAKRKAGKQYDWMVSLYFRDLWRVLQNVKRCLPTGAPVVWVVGDSAPYGIYLDTPGLLGLLGEELGFAIESEHLIRSRGKRWRTNGSRHQVDLCEKQVVWRAPGQD
jgi:hypothetical protein